MRALCHVAAFCFGLLSTMAASAQTVAVSSGEHDGFSRLVLTFPASALPDWTLSRTAEGYELGLAGTSARYNLQDVFRKISRDRLTAIWPDPATGRLKLRIGCACHAIPFQLRPGIVVIDIRDGVPPEGSSFELAADGTSRTPLGGFRPQPDPLRPGAGPTRSDWSRAARDAASPALTVNLPIATRLAPDYTKMREDLIREIGRSATEGVVDMAAALPTGPSPGTRADAGQMRIGPTIGIDPDTRRRQAGSMTASGDACIADTRLAIGTWGGEEPVDMAMGPARDGLVGEFDRIDPAAVERAVHFLLFLGFGVEARTLAATLDIGSQDRALWDTLSRVLDGDPASGTILQGMEVCDGAVALWSVLSRPEIPTGSQPQTAAILRSFSALPLHLRRNLGPPLADRFTRSDDLDTARAIRDAILRAPGDHGPAVALMAAKIDLAQGREMQAVSILEGISSDPGPMGVEATVRLIAALVAQGKAVDAATVTVTEAYLRENRGSPLEIPIRNALALGYATQGRFDEAFDLTRDDADAATPIWAMLADRGDASNLMMHAVVMPGALPKPNPETDRKIAARLIDLGFGDAGRLWLAPPRHEGGDDVRLLRAKADLLRRDARMVVSGLAGLDSPAAQELRGRALAQLGDPGATAALVAAGRSADAARSARRTRQWDEVAALEPDAIWAPAVALLREPLAVAAPAASAEAPTAPVLAPLTIAPQPGAAIEAATSGPLETGRAAVAESAAARARITALLAAVKGESASN